MLFGSVINNTQLGWIIRNIGAQELFKGMGFAVMSLVL